MTNWRDVQEQAEKFVFSYKDAKDEDRFTLSLFAVSLSNPSKGTPSPFACPAVALCGGGEGFDDDFCCLYASVLQKTSIRKRI